jgi:TonB family protein
MPIGKPKPGREHGFSLFSRLLCYKFRMRRSLLVIVTLCVLACCSFGQTNTTLPTVTAFECPKYPPKAESMRLQGMVKLEVTTDGHQVTDVKLLPSHPVLAEEAVKNVRTWKFADHTPTSFIVTYYYSNEGKYKKDPVTKCSAKMDLPSTIKVSTSF